ncbi:TIGR03757 family integrating conjugative element protein [Pseudomonas quasicaspiana]|nr:TIGR03757 family integrating conjugative element protein [Pseudomonas quasicaspiana]
MHIFDESLIVRNIRLIALATGLNITAFAYCVKAEALIITTDRYPLLATKDIRTINLDLSAMLENDLSSALPANPSKAAAIATKRITPDLAAQLTQAHQNVTDAWSMGVTKVPAVVVDRKYVVYGETNIQRAVDRIDEYQRKAP